MPRFLVTLSLGPVQSLIADARRTRDLWCGSWLLSEAARAAARTLHERQPGCLVFPCPDNPDQALQPQDAPRETANIANILRAEVTLADQAAVLALCNEAKSAAARRVEALGERARENLGYPVREDVWRTQIGDILESFAAWVEIANGNGGDGEHGGGSGGDGEHEGREHTGGGEHSGDGGNGGDGEHDGDGEYGGYREAGRRLGEALSARKATRNFRPCTPLTVAGLPKSSLDGARETVLRDWPAQHPARVKLRLSPGEQLDALGVIKRLAGRAEQFTALPRIAADTWIERLTPDQQRRLREAYKPLVDAGQATRVSGNADAYSALPFDGYLLYPSRLETTLAEAREAATAGTGSGRHRGEGDPHRHGPETAADGAGSAIRELEAFKQCITGIRGERNEKGQRVGTPVPYAAILKADGDRMGQLLSCARSAGDSRAISSALHGFASSVRGIVRDHRGHAIYAGGDDVLALLSLERARDCARALAESFGERLSAIAERMGLPADEHPTLSVGIGIGYVIDPLRALRALAERAERLAKGDGTETPRNALAILLRIRSGAELHWRAQWTDTPAFEALDRFIDAYRDGALPTRAAYDLRDIGRRLAWLRDSGEETARGMRQAEIERMLDRARRDGGADTIPGDLRSLIHDRVLSGAAVDGGALDEVADTLIIARWLSARTAGDVGERS